MKTCKIYGHVTAFVASTIEMAVSCNKLQYGELYILKEYTNNT